MASMSKAQNQSVIFWQFLNEIIIKKSLHLNKFWTKYLLMISLYLRCFIKLNLIARVICRNQTSSVLNGSTAALSLPAARRSRPTLRYRKMCTITNLASGQGLLALSAVVFVCLIRNDLFLCSCRSTELFPLLVHKTSPLNKTYINSFATIHTKDCVRWPARRTF